MTSVMEIHMKIDTLDIKMFDSKVHYDMLL